MKLLISLLLLIPAISFGQFDPDFWDGPFEGHPSGDYRKNDTIPATNKSCSTATFLCPSYPSEHLFILNEPDCDASVGVIDLFYTFRASETASSASVAYYMDYVVSGYFPMGYRVFEIGRGCNFCEDIELGNVEAIASGVFGESGADSVVCDIVAGKDYIIMFTLQTELVSHPCSGEFFIQGNSQYMTCNLIDPCEDCISGFQPTAGTYVVSAWVKDANAPLSATTYTSPYIRITSTGMTTVNCYPTGDIIDGWQRIEQLVTTVTDYSFNIELICTSAGSSCFFDDIRIFPYDGSMITYVYDPITLRLMAELDERNYAKLYEYDEEGKLIRVKKETEKGIMTIQENRENNSGKE